LTGCDVQLGFVLGIAPRNRRKKMLCPSSLAHDALEGIELA
jgi:hypothetical protein